MNHSVALLGGYPTARGVAGSTERVTDEELVVLARRGDTDAFDQLVGRHQAAVYRATLAALRVPEDAEEAAQDAFMRAWSSLGRFRGESSLRTWLLTIAWNRAVSRRRTVSNWLRRKAPLDDAAGITAARGTPHDHLRAGELRAHASRAIEALSPKLRDALLLSASGEYDYGEIAVMLKIPIGTLKWRVAEARKQVRARLVALGCIDAR
jgi:RNA polymerase sigma-70 factor (ECF subfamily)